MTLQARTALVLAIVTTLALGTFLVFDRYVLVAGFHQLEDDEVQRDASRVVHAVEVEGERLDVLVSDWSSWDDTYAFVQTRSTAFVASNLPSDILETLQLGAMVFLDADGRVVEERTALPGGGPGPIPELTPGDRASRLPELVARARNNAGGGVIRTGQGVPLLLVARPILRSDGSGTSRGTLVFARWLDERWVDELANALDTPVEFLPPSEAPRALLDGGPDAPHAVVARKRGQPLVGYGLVRDISGQPAIVARTDQAREVTALALRTTATLVAFLLLLGGMAAGSAILALRVTVLRPMSRLRREMAAIRDDPTGRVTAAGSGEVEEMARDVNRMLDRLAAVAEEQDRLERTARDQGDLAATALEAMSEGLVAFDARGFCTVCNPAAARLLHRSVAAARGRHISELLPGVHASSSEHPGGPQLIEVEGRTLAVGRSGGRLPVGSRHSVIVLRDVTDVLDIERLRRDVISTVSHELRTPLTAIQATVEMLSGPDAGPRNEVQSNLVSLLSRNVLRLRRILDDLLTLSALEGASVRLDRDRLDLGVLVTRVIEDLRPTAVSAGVELRADVRGEVVASVDEARLRQVVENLVQNAVKFSPPESAVRVSVASSSGEVRIDVTDHGPGIPPDELQRVFERFYRSRSAPRSTQGTGLGLPIARMIVELHGGRIWLESDGQTGTIAHVSLPIEASASNAVP